PAREGPLEPRNRHPGRRGPGDGGDGVRPRHLIRGRLRRAAGFPGEARAEIQGRMTPALRSPHRATMPFFESPVICLALKPRDRRISSVCSPFFGTRTGFALVVTACFAGWAMTRRLPSRGMSTAGRALRAATAGASNARGWPLTGAAG